MTREEVQDLLAMVQAAYPNYNPPNKTAAVNVWAMALEEYDKNEVAVAFRSYLHTNTSGFAPSIGQLISEIQAVNSPPPLNENEAWSLVASAIRNSGYNAIEEFAKLPQEVQRAVGQPGQLRHWAIDEDFNEGVEKASFLRTYRAELARIEKTQKLPSDIYERLQDSQKCSQKAQIEQKNMQAIKNMYEDKKSLKGHLEAKNENGVIPQKAAEAICEMKKKFGVK